MYDDVVIDNPALYSKIKDILKKVRTRTETTKNKKK